MQTDLLLEVKFSMNLTLKPTKFRTDSNFFQALFYFFFYHCMSFLIIHLYFSILLCVS